MMECVAISKFLSYSSSEMWWWSDGLYHHIIIYILWFLLSIPLLLLLKSKLTTISVCIVVLGTLFFVLKFSYINNANNTNNKTKIKISQLSWIDIFRWSKVDQTISWRQRWQQQRYGENTICQLGKEEEEKGEIYCQ